MQKTKVGAVEIIALVDTIQPYAASMVYPELGDVVDQYARHLDDQRRIALNFGCFLCIDGETRLLVDTGWGPEYEGRLPAELREAGVALDSITHVLFTHLHGDHTGWNLDRASGQPLFPNARYLVPKGDWDHYSSEDPPGESFVRDVVPLEAMKRMELIDGERTISAALTSVPTPGHTPGHTSVAISSKSERGFILGDVAISPLDVEDTSLTSVFHWDNALARKTRETTLDRLIEENALVGASHLPVPGLGRVIRTDGRRYWQAL